MGKHSSYSDHVDDALGDLYYEACRRVQLEAAKGRRVKSLAWQDVAELLAYCRFHADQMVWQPDIFGERAERPTALKALS